jgi:SAM-dependent methyltransferase
MDRPDASPEELTRDLHDLARINLLGWGRRLVWECVSDLVHRHPEQTQWTLLDLATGGGDIPRALVRWSRNDGLDLHVTATDLHPFTLNFAREQSREYPEITFEAANLLALPYADASFDLVTCSQALHHFGKEEIITALGHMRRIARRAVIVSDLLRSKPGYVIVWLALRLGGAGRYVRHDGPVSIKNGFRPYEMSWLAGQAGLAGPCTYRHRGVRFSMTWAKQ